MPALMSGRSWRAAFAGGPGFSRPDEGFVLPRSLRRPARLLARFTSGEIAAPRGSCTIMTVALLAAAGLYGCYVGGHVPVIAQAVTSRTGFAMDQVRLTGNRETSEIDILETLGLSGWTSLVGFNVEAARERVAGLPWVESASVRKVYPDLLEVNVVERKPFALWQQGRELSIIDASGRIIVPFNGVHHAGLPLVVGPGAAQAAESFVRKVGNYPQLASKVKGYVRVADRRWDLWLENGVTIKLPEQGEDAAIAELLELESEQAILSRDISVVDLRLSDRIAVQLTEDGAARRAEAVAAMEKARKSAARNKI